MKKVLLILASLFVSSLVMGQTTTENYIKTTTYQVETQDGSTKRVDGSTLSPDDKIESINYFDGLGRLKQSIAIQAGGSRQDIITPTIYDQFGRQVLNYLPYANTSQTTPSLDLRDQTSLISNIEAYYNSKFPNEWGVGDTKNPYSESHFEASPLNRMLEQGAPGADWAVNKTSDSDHTIKFDYLTNAANEVKHYTVSLSFSNNTYTPTLNNNGSYPANQLIKTVTKDENWTSGNNHTTEEFKDKQGRVVLKRAYTDSDLNNDGDTLDSGESEIQHDTYYVYDDYGNLTYVLPPKWEAHSGLPSGTVLDDLCYQYKYDDRNRLVEKKIPGKGWEYIVYNKLDLPILTQDQNLKVTNTWVYTKYDQFGRVAYTGLTNNADSRAAIQSAADGVSLQYVTQSTSSIKIDGWDVFYSNDANVYPTYASGLLTINYYDTYGNLPKVYSGDKVTTYKGKTSTSNVKGLPTVSEVRVLDTNEWITNVMYYDEKGRMLYTNTFNLYLNSSEAVAYDLDFTGKPLEVKTSHGKSGSIGITTYDQFSYDHMGRLISHKQEVNGQTPELIARNHYDELGVLYKKEVGGSTSLDEPPGTVRPDPNLPPILEGYTDIVGVSHNTSTNVITKTAGNGYNGGLATSGTIDGDGYVEFEMVQNNLYLTVGLAYSNPDTHYASIDYALDYNLYGGAYVYELGVSKSSQGGYVEYVPGDKFKIERIGDKVHYKKNDVTFYISTTTSSGNLLGDMALYSDQSKIKNFKIDRSLPTPESMYTDVFGLDYDETTGIMTKTIGNGWNGGLVTTNEISQNGYLEYEILQDDMYVVVGLASSNPDYNYTSMDFAIDHNGSSGAYVNELGVSKSGSGGYTTYVTGDVFKIERIGSTIYYKKNGNTFYTSSVSSTKDLMGDVALYSDQSKIKNFKLMDSEMLLRENNSAFDENNVTALQTINYEYNIRGWLKTINQDSFADNDLFNFTINYNDPTGSGTALYNGNISQTSWNTLNTDTSTKTYTYGYDALNRITSATDNTGRYNLSSVTYDKNGNITSLARQGHIVSNPNQNNASDFGSMDNLTYIYNNGNQLLKVTDSGNTNFGFIDGINTGDDYAYDANGNMIKNLNKNIPTIEYNHLNLPKFMIGGTVNNEGILAYRYDALGNRMSKTLDDADSGVTIITEYAGNYVYKNGELQFFNHPEGYLEVDDNTKKFEYVYQYKDHLGNIRLSYKDIDASNSVDAATEILEENNYYPFGLKHKGYNNSIVGTVNHFKDFQGQEFNEDLDLDWYSFKYRFYNPALARFHNIDPLAQEYAYQSPYNFSENRVIDGVELEGAERLSVHTPNRVTGKPIVRNNHPTGLQINAATAVVVARHPIASSNVGSVERGGTNISSNSGRIARHAASNGNMSVGEGSERNALRHATWVATIASNYGEKAAKNIGNAHEGIQVGANAHVDFSQPSPDNLSGADSVVDFLNNEIGVQIGAELGEGATEWDAAVKALDVQLNEGLWTATTDKDGNISISRTKITQKQYDSAMKKLKTLNRNGMNTEDRKSLEDENKN